MIIVFFTVLVIALPSGSSLQFEAVPAYIGLARPLTVNCSTTMDDSLVMTSLISLIIFRSTGGGDATFKELNSLNVFQPSGQVTEHLRDNQTATGIIDNHGVSYLSLVWEYPDASHAGSYRCVANGVDDAGHPVSINRTMSVQYNQLDTDELYSKLSNMSSQMELLRNMVLNQNRTIESMKTTVHDLTTNQHMWNSRIESVKHYLFNDSTFYDNHHYYLSYPRATASIKDFEAVCELFGGYLVEIDSIAEFNVLRMFILRHPELLYVMAGATDEAVEGHWVNIHSGTVAHTIPWGTAQPDGGTRGNCLWFHLTLNWFFDDGLCYPVGSMPVHAFMCEVPE